MAFSVLSEVGEYIRQIAKLFRDQPADVVGVVVVGSMIAGGVLTHFWQKVNSNGKQKRDGSKVKELESKLAKYSSVVSELEKDEADLWRLHPPRPPALLAERLRASRTRIVLIGHLKGGVSKTTLTANLAAYFDRRGKKVLAIDFDYQGSLTATLLKAAGKDLEGPYSDMLLRSDLSPEHLIGAAEHLHSLLPNTWIVPAAYTLVRAENHALIRWLLDGSAADVRYVLAELLLSPQVQNKYDIVLIDMGPRLTTASVSALGAATHLIVPTILDQLSAEAVGSFLDQVGALTREMKTGLNSVSIVGTMTRVEKLDDDNRHAIATIEKALQKWEGDAQVLSRNIPIKQLLIECAGRDIAILHSEATAKPTREILEQVGEEIKARIGL